ncbi:hypothetical protein CYMTET_24607, partial [Cymbomonas tetramitiformis]
MSSLYSFQAARWILTTVLLLLQHFRPGTSYAVPFQDGAVVTVAGELFSTSAVDGTGTSAQLNSNTGVIVSPDDVAVFLAERTLCLIRKVTPATGVVTTFAGTGISVHIDGTGTQAAFSGPFDLGFTTNGSHFFVADTLSIRRVSVSTGAVTTLAGSATSGSADGTGTSASFNSVQRLVLTSTDGIIYAADVNNYKIRKITISNGVVSTLCGAGSSGYADGAGTAASFGVIGGLALGRHDSYLYVADTGNHRIRTAVTSDGAVLTKAGSGSVTSTDGTGTDAEFYSPQGMDLTSEDEFLYIAEGAGNTIRRMSVSSGAVHTVAGSGGWGNNDAT